MEQGDDATAGGAVPLGFATAVSMWAVAYVGHLPVVAAPPWLVLVGLGAAAVAWGVIVGRTNDRPGRTGIAVGATAATLNLLILGSLLAGDGGGLRPAAAIWVPGSIVAVAAAVGLAALVAGRGPRRPPLDPSALFAWTAVAATFLLVVAGGLVTSNEAGLAVVDWPNTFGSNMFLYPLARMTGGIYYEHAHRLFGALVGLTTIGLAVHLWRRGMTPRWLLRLAGLAVILVVVQGLLGGLRVTGRLTLSTASEAMAPSIALAVAHGVLGQLFLALLTVIAVACLPSWRCAAAPVPTPDVATDRSLHGWLLAVLVVQLMLGAVQRHLAFGITLHVTLAAGVVMLAVVAGARAWWLRQGQPVLARLGRALVVVVSVQAMLGVAALAVTGGEAVVGTPQVLEVTVATAHQACGALLLATAVALSAWSRLLLAPSTSP
jgi:cytochrome c oxidase assembly protein subunit 15